MSETTEAEATPDSPCWKGESEAEAAHATRVEHGFDGICFLAGKCRLATPAIDVDELIPRPPLSRVPGAKACLIGAANLRGAVLPIVDLQQLLFAMPTSAAKSNRILVFRHDGVPVGLLVSEVLGVKHFAEGPVNEHRQASQRRPFMSGRWRLEDGVWEVIDIGRLVAGPAFRDLSEPVDV